MTDTVRSISSLLTGLFQDGQDAGEITAQDVRDLIVSLSPSVGSMYISTPAETSITTVSTPVKASGTTTLNGNSRGFDMPVDNRLRYTGTAPVLCKVHAGMSITAAGNNKLMSIYIAKNGVVDETTEQSRFISVGSDKGVLFVGGLIPLSQNDYIEIWIENETDNVNATIDLMVMSAAAWVA